MNMIVYMYNSNVSFKKANLSGRKLVVTRELSFRDPPNPVKGLYNRKLDRRGARKVKKC